MSTLTLKHDRKQRTLKQLDEMQLRREARKAQELRGYLRAANKMSQVKGRAINVMDLSPAQEIDLLEAYADGLEKEARDFIEDYPDKDGRYAARWFLMERAGVLDQIVRLKISSAKGEVEK